MTEFQKVRRKVVISTALAGMFLLALAAWAAGSH